MIIRDILGRTLATAGQVIGLPEYRLTERLTGKKEQTRPYLYGSAGGGYIEPGWTGGPKPGPVVTQSLPGVSGGGGQAPSGGGGGQAPAGQMPSQTPVDYSGYLETSPSQPDFSQYNQLFEQALKDIDTRVSQRETETGEQVSGIEKAASVRKESLQTQLGERLGELGQERTLTAGESTEAKASQRRQFSEIQQGLQARYGATTGTGAFATEIAGSQAMRNIASLDKTLQNNLTDIGLTEAKTRNETTRLVNEVDTQVTELIRQAKEQLSSDIFTLKNLKVKTKQSQSQGIMNAISEYQKTVSEVNQRNTAFKQYMLGKLTDFEKQVELKRYEATLRAYNNVQKLSLIKIQNAYGAETPYTFNPYSGELSPAFLPQGQTALPEEEENPFSIEALGTEGW